MPVESRGTAMTRWIGPGLAACGLPGVDWVDEHEVGEADPTVRIIL